MRRFFTDKIEKPTMKLTGSERKHLAEVLRARIGERVVICPNDGRDYVYETTAFDKDSVTLSFIEDRDNPTEPELKLRAYIAVLKGDKTELEVQKLTELGAAKITPFVCERTVGSGGKTERLRRAAHEAAKQCGRAVIPEVTDVRTLKEILPELRGCDAVVFAYEGAYGKGRSIDEVIGGDERSVAVVIGPEGGFTEEEVAAVREAGYECVTLGKRILRAETAAIAAAAVVMQLCGEWK